MVKPLDVNEMVLRVRARFVNERRLVIGEARKEKSASAPYNCTLNQSIGMLRGGNKADCGE